MNEQNRIEYPFPSSPDVLLKLAFSRQKVSIAGKQQNHAMESRSQVKSNQVNQKLTDRSIE